MRKQAEIATRIRELEGFYERAAELGLTKTCDSVSIIIHNLKWVLE